MIFSHLLTPVAQVLNEDLYPPYPACLGTEAVDIFSGSNGDPPGAGWQVFDDTNSSAEIYGNRLRLLSSDGQDNAAVRSYWRLTGDFIIIIDYDDSGNPAPAGSWQTAVTLVEWDIFTEWGAWHQWHDEFGYRFVIPGVSTGALSVPGRMRFVRNGNDVTFSYMEDGYYSGWIELGTKTGFGTGPTSISLQNFANNDNPGTPLTSFFDNLWICAEGITPPP